MGDSCWIEYGSQTGMVAIVTTVCKQDPVSFSRQNGTPGLQNPDGNYSAPSGPMRLSLCSPAIAIHTPQ